MLGSNILIVEMKIFWEDPMVADHLFIQIEKVLEVMEITTDTTRIRIAMFQLENEAQVWWKWARTS